MEQSYKVSLFICFQSHIKMFLFKNNQIMSINVRKLKGRLRMQTKQNFHLMIEIKIEFPQINVSIQTQIEIASQQNKKQRLHSKSLNIFITSLEQGCNIVTKEMCSQSKSPHSHSHTYCIWVIHQIKSFNFQQCRNKGMVLNRSLQQVIPITIQ